MFRYNVSYTLQDSLAETLNLAIYRGMIGSREQLLDT
jgi:hypothetical protein